MYYIKVFVSTELNESKLKKILAIIHIDKSKLQKIIVLLQRK
jgi:hypothetical protein